MYICTHRPTHIHTHQNKNYLAISRTRDVFLSLAPYLRNRLMFLLYFQPIRVSIWGGSTSGGESRGRVTDLLNAHVPLTMLGAWSTLAHSHFNNPWSWMMSSCAGEETETQGSWSNFPRVSHSCLWYSVTCCGLQRYFLRGASVLRPKRAQSSHMSWALIFTTSQWDGWKKEMWAWRG